MKIKLISVLIIFIFVNSCKTNNYVKIELLTSANPILLKTHVEEIIYDEQFRNLFNTKELDRVAAYIKTQLESYIIDSEYQNYSFKLNEEVQTYRNVVAKINVGKEKTFIIGAHYDVCGEQEGADDNASAVAGLLEIARLLSENRDRLKYNIEIVAYTLEEPPIYSTEVMGSYIHASSIDPKNIDNYAGMIALDMIGYYSDEKIQKFPAGLGLFYPKEANFIAAISNLGSKWISNEFRRAMLMDNRLPVEILAAPKIIKGVDFSDHRSYWPIKIDAIMITDTGFNRNINYHKNTDVIETLDFKKIGFVADGIVLMMLNE